MPRKSRKKTPEASPDELVTAQYEKLADQIAPIASTLDALKGQIPGLKSATELPLQLPDPRFEAEPPAKELVQPAPEQARPRPSHKLNGEEREQPSFVNKLASERPKFLPVPEGYKNVARHESAGIRVNKGVERANFGTAALQFAEDRPLSRATEYDLMEQVQKAGFQFKPVTRQWEKPKPEGMAPGENVIDGVRLAKEIADARGVGPGR